MLLNWYPASRVDRRWPCWQANYFDLFFLTEIPYITIFLYNNNVHFLVIILMIIVITVIEQKQINAGRMYKCLKLFVSLWRHPWGYFPAPPKHPWRIFAAYICSKNTSSLSCPLSRNVSTVLCSSVPGAIWPSYCHSS